MDNSYNTFSPKNSKLKRKEMLNLLDKVSDFVSKLKDCYNFENNIKKQIITLLESDAFRDECVSLISADFSLMGHMSVNEHMTSACRRLFELFNLRQQYISVSDTINNLYENYNNSFRLILDNSDAINNPVSWLFKSSKLKQPIISAYNDFVALEQNHYISYVNDAFNRLFVNTYTDSDLITAYNQYSKEWLKQLQSEFISIIPNLSNYTSDFLSKCNQLILDFTPILNVSLAPSDFAAEINLFRTNVQKSIICETKKEIVPDIYKELNKLPIEEINRDKEGFKVSLLASYGFNTLADIYTAQIQTIYSIPGISRNTAYKIRHKVDDMARLLEAKKKTVTEPLKINYDSQTKYTTNIVKTIYNCMRFLPIEDKFSHTGQADKPKVEEAISHLKRWKYDIDWLFFDKENKSNITNAYRYLNNFKGTEIYRNYLEYFQYCYKSIKTVDTTTAWEDFKNNSIAYYNCTEFLVPDAFEDVTFAYGLPEELAKIIDEEIIYPDGLTCELRRYQKWGVKYILHQERVLLGDEMGLGKTIQSIATMVSLKNVGYNHFIVICPASVLLNWFKEIHKHSKLQAYIGHGTPKERANAVKLWKDYGGVLISTYETYPTLKIDAFKNIGLITIDEAHFIKNPNAKRSKAIRALCNKINRVLFLTGTPIENHVDEMITLLRILNKTVADEASMYAQFSTSEQFKDVIAPVYFRRKQCDVNKELPEKIEIVDWCKMSEKERQIYDEKSLSADSYSAKFMTMRRVSWNVDDLKDSSKANALINIVQESKENHRKIVVFSFFKDTISKICDLFSNNCCPPIDGSVPPAQRQEIIDDFTNNPNVSILVAQIQAGGTGLNIQAASVVVICEPQVKPSIENQAIARAHRMGQSRTVIVHKLCCEDSIDQKMLQLLQKKQEEFDVFADKSVSGEQSLCLDESDMKDLIDKEIEDIKVRKKNREQNQQPS